MHNTEKYYQIWTSIWFIILIIFITSVIPYPTYNHVRPLGDGAEHFNNAMRVFNGEIPYRDFWLLFPPGEVILPSLIMKIFGPKINSLLLFHIIFKSIFAISVYLFIFMIVKRKLFSFAGSMLVFFNASLWPHHLFALFSCYFIIKFFKNRNESNIYIASFFIALGFWFRLYLSFAAFLGQYTVITYFLFRNYNNHPRDFIRVTLKFFIFPIVIAILMSIIFSQAWLDMVRQLFYESLLHGSSMNLPYFWSVLEKINHLKSDGFYFKGLVDATACLVMYLLPLFGVLATIYYRFEDRNTNLNEHKKFENEEFFIFLLIAGWGIFISLKSLGRSDLSHIKQTSLPWLLLIVIFISWINLQLKNKKKYRFYLCNIIFSFVLIILLYNTPNYANRFDFRTPKHKALVSTNYGSFWTDKRRARHINAVINKINTTTSEKEYIFVTPWFAPPLYALTNRRNPTYYDSLIDLVSRPSNENQNKICNDLLEKDTKLIIHNNTFGFISHPERLTYKKSCPILDACIEDNFELDEKIGGYWIYMPK